MLNELGLKYGTDKSSSFHDYLRIYERYLEPLRESAKKVLEIGIAGGASLKMWENYFSQATIFGVDHNVEYVGAVKITQRLTPLFGEATDLVFWHKFGSNWGGDFDLICDDGGHFSSQIIAAFEGAWPLLKSGGLYFIEDIHAIYQYDSGMKFFPWLEALMHRHLNEHGANQCGRPTSGDIEYIHLYKSLVVIKKR